MSCDALQNASIVRNTGNERILVITQAMQYVSAVGVIVVVNLAILLLLSLNRNFVLIMQYFVSLEPLSRYYSTLQPIRRKKREKKKKAENQKYF